MEIQQQCPLCGGDNHCGVANAQQSCWYMTEHFPKPLLASVSSDGQQCICPHCLHTYQEDERL
ncbi:cysteine-rich CWC family protein [Lysinibacillus piscis]|uniref:Cysteine-rich CWC family protein n=1 Tax=Lysinibacillus piscis TaxID=2518931 RepID=A0ABQ5NQE9_9BACI|nr:cysteine-rich CWC family protein [Lysinibacillus sp. KH24]GLC90352.1 hypothetical protein LYSBPC_34790 [Lysinibacillus sp. KH24]